MTMRKAVALLVFSILVAAAGVVMLIGRVNSGLVNAEIGANSPGARLGENAATPGGVDDISSGSAGATVTAAVRQATALAATANAVLTPIPSTPGAGNSGIVAIGQSVEVNGSRYTVLRVVDPEPPGLFQTTAGNRRVAIELTQEAMSAPQSYNFASFQLRDAAGKLYTWAITNSSPGFQSGTLKAGESRRGWISFQVPTGVEIATLILQIPGRAQGVPIVALR